MSIGCSMKFLKIKEFTFDYTEKTLIIQKSNNNNNTSETFFG